mmetsp:Transcript_8917/g.12338  ORF Transcript_8917/g.12338 Transcript_8917/m.12338 type:complete len:209 (-) Transcript_8917:169-795(-)|eukprot:CAMPEP_0185730550 /NCGR_PEP_ID=MMETSP1171-20130828/10231_1 /TAXON_ID=374046 /ORGANISM="Helicotheca tamensis, Strain CCMP826" /LENGTH=208 /DNA_ID=CAMNT_0028399621 /DNA_START=69 /DNA_END=695 /DNA_ORIENTATION=-
MPPHGNDSPLQVVAAPSPEPKSGPGPGSGSRTGEADLPPHLSVPPLDESDIPAFAMLEMEGESPRKALTHCMDAPAESRPRSEKSKSVSFGSLQTREYNVILGDHECCTEGPPLSLGWNYTPNPTVPLDDYERSRAPRRSRRELRQRGDIRRDILLSHAISETPSCSADDIKKTVKRAERKLNRQRMNRKANALFFQPIHTGPATHSE